MVFVVSSIVVGITSAIGSVVVLWCIYNFYSFLTFHFWISKDPLRAYRLPRLSNNEKASGSVPCALITAGSGGIGFGYALSLVERGFGVILLSNDHDGLARAKTELQQKGGSIVETIYMDACTATPKSIHDAVVRDCIEKKDLRVSILINNVGGTPMPHPMFRIFAEYDIEDIDRLTHVNSTFMTYLTHVMLPVLAAARVACDPSSRSLIINMSSGSRVGLPWLSIYSASKAYVVGFSQSLAREFRATGQPVDCIAITPGDVHSEANNVAHGPGTPLAKDYGKIVLDCVDQAVIRNKLLVSPFWLHAIETAIVDLMPERWFQPAVANGMASKKRAFGERDLKIISHKQEVVNPNVDSGPR